MEDVKKWSVTYTKHIKQKRKVYQDGFLDLHCSNGTDKVLLYDDDMKVLESRFSKKDEVVGCGETLTFGGYLVDVGDLSSDVDCQKAVTGSSEKNVGSVNYGKVRYNIKQEIPETKVGLARRPSFKPSIKKETLESNVGSVKHPSVRYNVKKESPEANVGPMKRANFRSSIKREKENNDLGHKAPENHSSMINDTGREWCALYTSQKTQRAKKYHDGILRLVAGMFDRRQVILYDDSRKQLDSKYLKKEEVVECGETLTLDCYLVEVVEEHSEPLSDLNIQGRAKISIDNFGKLNDSQENGSANSIAPENCPSVRHIIKTESESSGQSNNLVPESRSSIKENINREWHALYTTQKTQKAKKYHDGILRLVVGVAQRRQVTLLNEDGTTLSSKYLSLSEDVRTGRVLELASHLIEVGEERISEEGLQNDDSSGVAVDSSSGNVGSIIPNSSNIGKNNMRDGVLNTSSGKDLVSNSGTSEKANFTRSSIRDANQILSNLKRPTGKSTCPAEELFIGKATSSQPDSNLSQKIVIDSPEEILEDSIEILNGASNTPEVGHRSKISHSEDIDKTPSSDPDCGWKLLPPVPPLLKVSLRLISETGTVYPGEHTEATIFNSTGSQDSDVVMSDMPDETRKMKTEIPHDGFDDGLQIKACHFFTGSEASDGDNGQMTSGVLAENSYQLCIARMEKLPTHRSAEVTFPSLNGSGSCSNGAGRANTEVLTSKPKEQFLANEFPSFDLGF